MLAIRPATPADAVSIAALVLGGIRAYTGFTPPGWSLPAEADAQTVAELERRLPGSAWGFVAVDGAALAGASTLLPAAEAGRPDPAPGLVHLWHLFVAQPHWGTGLATRLLAAAVESAAARGYTQARLFTPSGQARARRFYEREGWTAVTDPSFDERIGFEIVEYRRGLATRPAPSRSADSPPTWRPSP